MMVNPNVHGYTKLVNNRKILQKT